MTPIERLNDAKAAARAFMAEQYPDRQWFICGGALRDTDLGKPFKDVDVFVSGFETDPEPRDEFGLADIGDRNAYLMRAFTIDFMGFDINVILMRTPWTLQTIAERCDFGICQIAWCPETDQTYRSEPYLHDINDRTVTATRATHPERWERMQAKFPLYRMRNPRNLPAATGGWHYVNGEVVKLG